MKYGNMFVGVILIMMQLAMEMEIISILNTFKITRISLVIIGVVLILDSGESDTRISNIENTISDMKEEIRDLKYPETVPIQD